MTDAVPFPAVVPMSDASALIGLSSVQVLAPGQIKPGARYLYFSNSGLNNGTIWYSYTAAAAVGQPGSYPLPPGSEVKWRQDIIPAGPLYAISTVAGTLLTVMIG